MKRSGLRELIRAPRPHAVIVAVAALLGVRARGAQLPVPCAAGACGAAIPGFAGAPGFVAAGAASVAQSGSKLTITQTSNNAVLNWQSFNISADGSVQFVQPSASSAALNQIFDSNPSTILGSLSANGQIFLINQNGIIFGPTAQVNVGSLVASSLSLNSAVVSGTSSQPVISLLQPANNGQAALTQFSGATGGAITVQQGASLQASQGGQILLFAPQITNEGAIDAPGGQALLAAGTEIYLAASTDPTLRGLLVEIGNAAAPGTTPTVTNGAASNATVSSPAQLIGQITAQDGNVTLAALAVNQLGRVSATTAIEENGSIVLQARSGSIGTSANPSNAVASNLQNGYTLQPGTGGTLTLGAHSSTQVTLDTTDTSTTVDSVAQPLSDVKMYGAQVQILNDSTVTATSGDIDVTALVDQTAQVGGTAQSDGSSIYVAPGATLDVSGATVELPASSVVIPVDLLGTELADFPLQRNGALRGTTVYVDSQLYGTRADGSSWVGTPLADVSGEIEAMQRNVVERNLDGGNVSLQAQGDVIVAPGATINIAGGAIDYSAGYLDTTQLVQSNGTLVDISQADPNQIYTGIAGATTVSDTKWGTSTTYALPGRGNSYNYQSAYVQGENAGSVTLVTPRFILDGSIDGQVTVGTYQREPAQPASAWPLATMYAPYNEAPLPGTLIIGASASGADPELLTGAVTFSSVPVLPGLTAAGFDPTQDALPASYTASVLNPSLFGPQGIGKLQLNSDAAVTLPAGVQLNLPAGGGVSITADSINVQGSIDAPAGTIDLQAEATAAAPDELTSLVVGPTSQLLALGGWVNDSVALNPNGPSGPLYLNGGSVSLSASGGNLTLDAGSLIDVSGGAQLTSSGTLVDGAGGDIKLAVSPLVVGGAPTPTTLSSAATLRGYGLSSGGSLSLTADSVCIASTDCTAGDASVLWLTPASFQQGGFGSYAVNSSLGGLTVEPGTVIDLVQQNLSAPANLTSVRSSAAFESLSGVGTVLLPVYERDPTSLSLSASVASPTALGAQQVASAASLSIGTGAVIQADPLASIALSSDTRIIDDGTLQTPGGTVSMLLNDDLSVQEYAPSQAIWLGPDSSVNVAGTTLYSPNNAGLPTGTVLAGGSVSISAQRGYIEMQPGALINVSGTSAAVADLNSLLVVGGALEPVVSTVASAGGSVSLTAAEGMAIDGSFLAAAGSGAARTPAGGSLSVTLDPSQRGFAGSGQGLTFPSGPGTIVLTQALAPVVVAPGSAVPDAFDGEALLAANTLNGSGFDSLSLSAGLATSDGGGFANGGIVSFSQNVALNLGESININAAAVQVSPGATATLAAPYVSIGNADDITQNFQSPIAGTGTLVVQAAQQLNLSGSVALQGIGQAQLASTGGDIRLTGLELPATNADGVPIPTAPVGQLASAGDIELSAAQIYPTTLTQFTVSSTAPNGTIDVENSGAPTDSVLSAGGALTLSAANITQNGVLRAPFGTITLEGAPGSTATSNITLGAGSLTSTSADGLVIPFGTTQGGFDWTYPLANGTLVYGTDGLAPPAQQINLIGTDVQVQGQAKIDVSGGGDLLAYEFLPDTTTGGTTDVLASTTSFAVVPSIGTTVAPYDPNISAGSPLALGESVYLSASAGLPAGTYTLLPARDALLPGAFLVTPVSGYSGIPLGEQLPNPGGGSIVAGYRAIAGTSIADSQTSGFAVVPASVFEQEATYTTSLASQFFPAQAQSAGVTAPRLPVDAGVLELVASNQLQLNGTLVANAGAGGLGAFVDIASSDIEVVPDGSTAQTPGAIALSVGSLEQLGAQSLLLGGQRSGDDITTEAQSVTLDAGAQLSGPEILLTATNQVVLDSGASISASGSAPPPSTYTLSGDGAFLSASAGPIGSVTRSGASGAAGLLDLQSGSTVTALQGSLYLDGSSVLTDGTLSLNGADLAIQSSSIGLAPAGTVTSDSTLLGPAVLSAEQLRSLSLVGSSSIDLYGSLTAGAQNLTLDTPALLGHGGASDVVTLNVAGTLQLRNSQGGAGSGGAADGTGALTLNADDVLFGGGELTTAGFGVVSVNAPDQISASTDSTLSATGNLTLTTSRLTSAPNVSLGIVAGGALLAQAPQNLATLTPIGSLGGSITLTGQSVELGTAIDLPSGQVQLSSTGGVSGSGVQLDAGAAINVAGQAETFNGQSVVAPGGTVSISSAGNVLLAAGSSIDVSAAEGTAGSLSISALNGTVGVNGTLNGAGASGGSFNIDAQGFGDFGNLNQLLNTAGFTGQRSVELRGPGDLTVASGAANAITASGVELIADDGSVTLQAGGTIDASGLAGGTVVLAASDNVTVDGTIDAYATGAGQRGGQVDLELESSSGQLQFANGAVINVAGGPVDADGNLGAGGTVLARVPQSTVAALATGGSAVVWQGGVQGAQQTTLEAYQSYQVDGVLPTADEQAGSANPLYQDAATFMASAPAIQQALGQAANPGFVIEPGIELDDTDPSTPLTLSTPWDLYAWRFNGDGTADGSGVPGVLTVRAADGIAVDASLSDGFVSATAGVGQAGITNEFAVQPTNSWSYRLVGGADFSSANVLAVDAATPADVSIGANTMVRTGNGFIDVAASGDFSLAQQTSVLYTAGTAGAGIVLPYNGLGTIRLAYPTDGGDIDINVDGNIDGAPTNQLFSSWLWRVGSTGSSSALKASPVAWTVNYQYFDQGVAALGGGDVNISASGDITNLSASIPSIGVQVGGTTYAQNQVDVTGGGNLTVQAGGSIVGGSYYVGLGNARLVAGQDIGGAVNADGSVDTAPVLGLGDAQASVQTLGNLELGAIVNPTLLPEGSSQSTSASQSYFSTYSPGAAVNLVSVGGDVTLQDNSGALQSQYSSVSWTNQTDSGLLFDILPPTLNVAALGGDITFGGLLGLFPAPKGNLSLLAEDSIYTSNGAGASGSTPGGTLIVSDADPTLLPSVAQPATTMQAFEYLLAQQSEFLISAPISSLGIAPDAAVPVHSLAAQPDGQPDSTPVTVVAASGNIDFSGGESGIISAKPADVVAGGNIIDLGLVAQNLVPSDVTVVSAGGSIDYPLARNGAGQIIGNFEQIAIDGPGALSVSAGNNLNLGSSTGITSRGNLVNSALPAGGADVSVTVGTGTEGVNDASFISQYVEDSDQFDAVAVAYMQTLTGSANLSIAQAKQALEQLSPAQQALFVQYALAPQYTAAIQRYIDGATQYDGALTAYVQQVTGQSGLSVATAKQLFGTLSAQLQDLFIDQVVFTEINTDATEAVSSGSKDYAGAFAALTTLFPGANPDLASGQSVPYQGDIDLYFSRIYTLSGGNVSLLAPGGDVDVGLATPPSSFGISKAAEDLGLVAEQAGNVSVLSYGDFTVDESRVFAADGGNILVWSTDGNIDAGRGAKSAISAPAPTITIGPNGQPIVTFPTALAGSGIQALTTTPGVKAGDVSLFAPHGVVNANDAGIVAGNLTIGATAVLGANNITVTGTAIGLPVVVTGLGASLSGATSTAAGANNAAQAAVTQQAQSNQANAPIAQAALNWIDVFVIGLGQENCAPGDLQCLKRQQTAQPQ